MRNSRKISSPNRTFFTFDPHFNHGLDALTRGRGVESKEALTELTIRLWNERVPPNGIVYCLGDFCLRDPGGTISRNILKRLHFEELYLLWGNHNSGVSQIYVDEMRYRFGKGRNVDYEVYPLRIGIAPRKTVTFMGHYLELRWDSQLIVLCHFAMRNWLQAHHGAWMLCGHSHGNDPNTRPDSAQGRILDVGFDSVGGPLSLSEVHSLLSDRPIVAPDVHRPVQEPD